MLYANNYKSGVPRAELISRSWHWMKGFAANVNLMAGLMCAIAVFFYVIGPTSHIEEDLTVEGATARRLAEHGQLEYTVETELQHSSAIHAYNLKAAQDAAWEGIDPLIWLFMGLGFLLKFYAFVDQLVQPFTSLSIFVLSVRQVGHATAASTLASPIPGGSSATSSCKC